MNINDPYVIVLATSTMVVFSYLFDWISKKTNFPSVLLLLGVGIGLRWFFFTSENEKLGIEKKNELLVLNLNGNHE